MQSKGNFNDRNMERKLHLTLSHPENDRDVTERDRDVTMGVADNGITLLMYTFLVSEVNCRVREISI